MRITIVGFKCYQNKTFDIKDSDFTLIRGVSGSGKTTIIHAITWALFGTMRNVDSISNPKGKLMVELVINNLTIMRQKRPGLLKVQYNNSNLEDREAQCLIDSLFCIPSLWNAVGYIPSGEINALLSVSNNDRLDLLNHLAFHGDDPDLIINKIDSQLSISTNDLNSKQAVFDSELKQCDSMVQQMISNDAGIQSFNITRSEEAITKDLTDLSVQLDKLLKVETAYIEYKSSSSIIMIQIKEISDRITLNSQKIKTSFDDDELTALEHSLNDKMQELNTLNHTFNEAKRYNELNNTRLALLSYSSPVIDEDEKTLQAQLDSFNKEELQYSLLSSQCTSIGVEYSKDRIEQAIATIDTMLSGQPYLILKSNITQLSIKIEQTKSDIDKLKNKLKPIDKVGIDKLKSEIDQLINLRNLLKCPSCGHSLRYASGQLVKDSLVYQQVTDNDIYTKQNELQSLHNEYQQFTKISDEITNTESSLNKLQEEYQKNCLEIYGMKIYEGAILSQRDIYALENNKAILNKITIVPKPDIDTSKIRYKIDLRRKQDSLREIESLIPKNINLSTVELRDKQNNINNEINIIRAKLTALRNKHNEYKIIVSSYNNDIKLLKTMQDRLPLKVEDPSISINECRSKLKAVGLELTRTKQLMQIFKLRQSLNFKKVQIDQLTKTVTNISRLKKLALDIECYQLQHTVNTLNTCIADINSYLFDIPISVSIRLFKETKTTGKVKPQVNVVINYRSMEFTDIKQLSSGERDRVGIALTLAMNRLSGCPILILDESISLLDSQSKDSAIKSIRTYSTGKTVIMVCHASTTGLFDHVLDLS